MNVFARFVAPLSVAASIFGSPAIAQQDAGANKAPTGPVAVMPVADGQKAVAELFKSDGPFELAMFNGKNIGIYLDQLVSADATIDGVNELVKQAAPGIVRLTVLDPNDPAVSALLTEYRETVAHNNVSHVTADGNGSAQDEGSNQFFVNVSGLAASEIAPPGLAAISIRSLSNTSPISDGALQALANAENAPSSAVADTTNVANQPAATLDQVTAADAAPVAVVANNAAAQPVHTPSVFLDGNFRGYIAYSPSMNGGKGVVVTDSDNRNLLGYALVDTSRLADITNDTDATTFLEFSESNVTWQKLSRYEGYGLLYLDTASKILMAADVRIIRVNFNGTSNIQLEDNYTYTALVRDMQVLSPDDAKDAVAEIKTIISGPEFQTEQFTSLASLAAPVDNNPNPAINPAPAMDNAAASAPAFVGELVPNVSVWSNDANNGQGGWVPQSTMDVYDPFNSFTNSHRWVDGQNGQQGGWVTDNKYQELFPGKERRVNTPAPTAAVQDATTPAAQSVESAVNVKPTDPAFMAAYAKLQEGFADANGGYAAYLDKALKAERSDAAAKIAAEQAKTAKAEADARAANAAAAQANSDAAAAKAAAAKAEQAAGAEKTRADAAEQTAAGRFGGWAVALYSGLGVLAGAVFGGFFANRKIRKLTERADEQDIKIANLMQQLSGQSPSNGTALPVSGNGRGRDRASSVATGLGLAAAASVGIMGQNAAQAAPVPMQSSQTTTAVAANGNAKSASPFGVFIDGPGFSGELAAVAGQMYRVNQYSR